ncbi:MAG TPA: hypothetical protein VFY45_04900 [Baekduia sp.]|nr:hypothetical protein [Baekduia sp.]
MSARERARDPSAGSTPERALSGEVLDPCGLAARASEVAARQRSPETRRTYAAVHRIGMGPRAEALKQAERDE